MPRKKRPRGNQLLLPGTFIPHSGRDPWPLTPGRYRFELESLGIRILGVWGVPTDGGVERGHYNPNPGEDTLEEPAPVICPDCGKECKSEFGLQAHMRACKGDPSV